MVVLAAAAPSLPFRLKLTDGGSGCNGCAVQQPDTPALPLTPEDGSNCSGCATPTPPILKLADPCSNCARRSAERRHPVRAAGRRWL